MSNRGFGERIRQLRKQAGLTQRELGKLVGVDFTYLSKIEGGSVPAPSEKVIARLSEVLKADRDELFALAGKIPSDIAPVLKNREALQLLRSERAQQVFRASNKIRGGFAMTRQNVSTGLGFMKDWKNIGKVAVAILLVAAVSATLWFSSPVKALTVGISNPSSGTLGGTYTFNTTVTIASAELLPIQSVNLYIYNVDNRATYEAVATGLPLGSSTNNYTSLQTGGGDIAVTGSADVNWTYMFGSGNVQWQGYSYTFGNTFGYGYGPGATTLSYTVTWSPPASWPAASYQIEVRILAATDTFSQTGTAFSLVASGGTGGNSGSQPPVAPSTTKTADVTGSVNADGVFTQGVTVPSTDNKVSITINSGVTGKKADGTPLAQITISPITTPPSPPTGSYIVTSTYDFGPPDATFNPAIPMTFTYLPENIPAGFGENTLAVAYYNSTTGQWTIIEGGVLNQANSTFTVFVNHFTQFTVMTYLRPAAFTPSALTVNPKEANPGQTVTLGITVTNTGNQSGDYTVTLKVDGAVVGTKQVNVVGGRSSVVTFTTTSTVPGTHNVDINGVTNTFVVKAPPPSPTVAPPVPTVSPTPTPKPPVPTVTPTPTPTAVPVPPPPPISWGLIAAIAAAVIIVAVVAWWLIRRRMYYS